LLEIQRAQGHTFVQDEQSSIVAGMPNAAIHLGATKRALSPDAILQELMRLASGNSSGGGGGAA
jgi:chemotaxis response regulator CheB